MKSNGEPFRRHWREPTTRNRRLVLLLDVSGSMEPYARALLRFVHAAVAGRQKVEAFALGTRLTRITRELSSRDPDIALRQTSTRVVDWSGGTRLGDGLRQFNDAWGQRGMATGRDRRHPLRRMGPRRPYRARRADGSAPPRRPPGHLGEPAEGHAGLRPARPRHGSRVALRRRVRRGPFGRRPGRARQGNQRRRHDRYCRTTALRPPDGRRDPETT